MTASIWGESSLRPIPATTTARTFCSRFSSNILKGTGDAKLPKAYVFETGTNVWRRYSAWPPKQAEAKTLYFHAGGGLSFDPPASDSPCIR